MKGTVSTANFSLEGIGGGEGGGGDAGAAAFGAGAGVGVADGEGAGTASLLAADGAFDPPEISILVKYRNPPTPMATRQITITTTGHIQFGAAAAAAGFFFNCGIE